MAKRVRTQPNAPADLMYVAYDALKALGHTPTSDKGRYACWICELEGQLRGSTMTGEIFEEKCR